MDGEQRTLGDSRSIVAEDGRRYAFADHNCFACGGRGGAYDSAAGIEAIARALQKR